MDNATKIKDYQKQIKDLETLKIQTETNKANNEKTLEELEQEFKSMNLNPANIQNEITALEKEIEDKYQKLDNLLPSQEIKDIQDVPVIAKEDFDIDF